MTAPFCPLRVLRGSTSQLPLPPRKVKCVSAMKQVVFLRVSHPIGGGGGEHVQAAQKRSVLAATMPGI